MQHRATTLASAIADVGLRSIVIESNPAFTHHPHSATDERVIAGLHGWAELGYLIFVVLMSPCGTHSVNHHPTPEERLLAPYPLIPRLRYPLAARLGAPGLPPAMQQAVDASNAIVEAADGIIRHARRRVGAGFIIESAIDRGDPGTAEAPNPHFREWFATHAPLWLTPPILALTADLHAVLHQAPQCAFGSLYQKWTAFLADPDTAALLAFLSKLSCCGASPHSRRARGWAVDGSSQSAPAGAFPDVLYHTIAQAIRRFANAWQPSPLRTPSISPPLLSPPPQPPSPSPPPPIPLLLNPPPPESPPPPSLPQLPPPAPPPQPPPPPPSPPPPPAQQPPPRPPSPQPPPPCPPAEGSILQAFVSYESEPSQRVASALSSLPEHAAVVRAESDRTVPLGRYSQARIVPESLANTRLLHIESAEHEDCATSPRPDWRAVHRAHSSYGWRPKGGARGLFIDRPTEGWDDDDMHPFDRMQLWGELATEATAAAREGRPFVAPPDLDLPAHLLRPEASAMGSWVTAGHHRLHPVPACDFFTDPTSDLKPDYFDSRVAEGDEDEAIASEVRQGLADDSTVSGTFMAWHHASFATYVEASAAAIVSDLELGRFVSLGSGVPTVPHRCVPHGCVDQSTPAKKKVRCITDHTYPFGRPSTNAGTDLSLYPDTHLSSGVAVGRQVGIVRAAGAGSVVTKRDAVAAFRQVPVCPSDYWKCGLSWETGILVDVRLSFGSRIAVNKYQRLMLVCARHAMQEVASFDASHPTTVASVTAFLADRAAVLGPSQARLAALTQYVDDAHLVSTADAVTPSPLSAQGRAVLRLRGGGSCQRGLAHGVLLDDVYTQAGIIIDTGDKMVDVVNDDDRNDPPVEALGVEIDAAGETLSYPKAKVPRLRELIDVLINEALTGTVSVGVMESTLGKEKWAAHVAVEINPLLASTHATLHAALRRAGHSRGRLGGRQRSTLTAPPARSLISDQRAVHAMADHLPPIPLVPASIFPPAASGLVAHPFQDASEKFGIGGFFHDSEAGCFRYYIMG